MSNLAPNGTSYDVYGVPDAPAVVLIHGLGLSRRLWDDHLAAYADYRVLCYDLFGHGNSIPSPEVCSLSTYARQLAEVMDHIKMVQAHIVGFSIGGMINRRFALDYPEKTRSLVIMNSPHDRGDEAQKMVEDRARSVREQGAFSTFDAALARWFTPGFREKRPDVTQMVRDWRGQVDGESYAQTAWVLANGVVELINPSPPLAKPALVMTCENDSGSTPAMSHAIASEIAGSRTQIIPKLQHLGLMEDADAFTQPIIDFLKEIS